MLNDKNLCARVFQSRKNWAPFHFTGPKIRPAILRIVPKRRDVLEVNRDQSIRRALNPSQWIMPRLVDPSDVQLETDGRAGQDDIERRAPSEVFQFEVVVVPTKT